MQPLSSPPLGYSPDHPPPPRYTNPLHQPLTPAPYTNPLHQPLTPTPHTNPLHSPFHSPLHSPLHPTCREPDLPLSERFSKAAAARASGTERFKGGQFAEAASCYEEAIGWFEPPPSFEAAENVVDVVSVPFFFSPALSTPPPKL